MNNRVNLFNNSTKNPLLSQNAMGNQNNNLSNLSASSNSPVRHWWWRTRQDHLSVATLAIHPLALKWGLCWVTTNNKTIFMICKGSFKMKRPSYNFRRKSPHLLQNKSGSEQGQISSKPMKKIKNNLKSNTKELLISNWPLQN